ncbi:MAG: glycosyltransferase family 2 protein [Gaiellales bacterium]
MIPCLDEEEAIASVVDRAWHGIELSGRKGEVIVVDNASTDRSAEIATSRGARVVYQPNRGYGNAYLAGLANARGRFIVMGDADGTYDFAMVPEFVDALDTGADMVLGSRLQGQIHKDAMPWSHRWIGNPLITGMINLMFKARVSDAYCGLRAVRRDVVPSLELRSPGMEFALEMVFKAARLHLEIAQIPIEYHRRQGDSKLNSMSDGWRSVKFILVHSPSYLFFVPALALVIPGLAGCLALAAGPVDILGHTWKIDALHLSVALLLLGVQIASFGLVARTFGMAQLGDRDMLLERLFGRFRLEHALIAGATALAIGLLGLSAVFAIWATEGFGVIRHEHQAVLSFALAGLGVQLIFTGFLVAIVGRPAHGEAAPERIGEPQVESAP